MGDKNKGGFDLDGGSSQTSVDPTATGVNIGGKWGSFTLPWNIVNYPPAKDGWASWFSELGLQLTRGMFRRTSMVPFVEAKLSPGVDSLGSLAILCLNCLNFLVRVWDLFCNSLIIPLIQCWDFTLKQTASRTAYPVVKERLFVIIRDMFGLNLWACRRFIPAAKDRRAFSPKQNGRILSFSWFSVTPWTNFRKGKEDA